ncbi:MAG: hypothetical protein HYR74_00765 [Candidatus Eisenbacteria bacterium]|nr:hypothetical protein [Candidatus Eisenbacteria bacterium]
MLIVRDVFTAKPGQASKLAKLFKGMAKDMPGTGPARVLTDLVGDYNTVVMEFEFKNLGEYEKAMMEYSNMQKTPENTQRMAEYQNMYQTGKREILRSVD